MKKLFTILLALVATTALRAHDFSVNGIYYNILTDKTNEVEVTYRGSDYYDYDEYSGSVTIPSSVTYNSTTYSVTSIGEGTFSYCKGLTSITIPNSVTSIGNGAFYECSSLTSITIPNSVTSIGYSAFNECSSLTSITIPNSVTSIEDWAFRECSGLTSITIPNSVTSIGEGAFEGCSGLTSITIPNSVTSIGDGAFKYCSRLTSVTIPNSITSIGNSAFDECSSLTSITIPNSITSIGESVFRECSGLTSITIPNSVTSIGNDVFNGCSGLTSVTIPNSVTSIGYYAFAGCSSLTSITIPNSVTSIGEGAFASCSSFPVENNLRYADTYLVEAVDKTLSTYSIKEGTKWIGSYAFYGCSSLKSITIPNSVTSIGDAAFSGCKGLTSVTLGNSVTSIEYSAFYKCSSLTSVTIGNSVTSIGMYAFKNCSALTSITIPNSVTSIGYQAFYNCSALTSVTIGNSVTSIRDGAFRECSALTKTNYTGDVAAWCDIEFGDYEANPICYSNNFYINDQEIKDLFIPNTVDTIYNYAFAGCSGLTSVAIGNSVTSIGEDAFRECSGLTSITIPNSVTSIGNGAFYECSGLTSVTIGNCVTSIGNMAFYGCSALTKTNYTGDVAVWCDIKFGSYIANPIYYSNNFYINDQEIKDLFIPNTVDTIYNSAFSGCKGLTSVTLGNSVTSIGNRAFYGCSSLTSIKSLAEVPPTLGSDAFYNVSTQIPVYVCAVSAYQSAEGWKAFTNIQEILVEYFIAVGVNDSIMGTAKVDYNTYCEDAQISATANYGYHFVQWSDGNTDNPRALVLTQDTALTAEFAVSYSGQCGDNLYWAYDEDSKKISITGSGDMYDYTKSTQPWYLFQEQITEVTTSNTTTGIGTSAFEGCIRLGKVSLGYGMEDIAANAFAACKRLYDIYVYASYPPFAEESSFANYNVYLYIPCENQRDYILDVVWGEFKFIECIGAESDETGGDDVTITPGSNDVTITWPTDDNADTYSIVIEKDGKVVCTLTFNADGQLMSIAFAPGRDGNHPAQYAEAVANGYRFTVTGLEEGTKYAYNLDVKDSNNQTIQSYSGEFTTMSDVTTDMDNISSTTNIQKIIRNGQLLIIHEGKTYNAQGAAL